MENETGMLVTDDGATEQRKKDIQSLKYEILEARGKVAERLGGDMLASILVALKTSSISPFKASANVILTSRYGTPGVRIESRDPMSGQVHSFRVVCDYQEPDGTPSAEDEAAAAYEAGRRPIRQREW